MYLFECSDESHIYLSKPCSYTNSNSKIQITSS